MSSNLKIENLFFNYQEDLVLKKINLFIEKGSFLTIIGPNGSGKSTLLKVISKLVAPNRGKIWLDDLDLLSLSPRQIAQRMAVVPQNIHTDFPFTVWETVLMGRSPFLRRFENEGERDFALAKWAMEITNTLHLKDRKLTEISGGELQRVIVARALTQEPKIILLDEPTSHLDIQHQLELLELLESLNQTGGLTVVAVLHDLNLAAQFSQYILLMKNGEVVALGPPAEVLTPANIRDVYGIEVTIKENPLTGKFNVIPLARSKSMPQNGKGINIHLICGGGSGTYIMDTLVQSGYNVSAGVLNIGDTDWTHAKKLGLKVSEEAPFNPISEKSLQKNRALLEKAQGIIITPVPFGHGNLGNLKLALDACKKGTPVLIIQQEENMHVDFTNGQADILWKELKKTGAHFACNLQEIFTFLDIINERQER